MSEHYEGMGSCKTHGWWEVDGQNECPSCENARLRDEVEILTQKGEGLCLQNGDLFMQIHQLKRERDEAQARIRTLEATLNDIPCSGPAGCEAPAQVAVLLDLLEKTVIYVEAARRIKPDERVHIVVEQEIQRVRKNVLAESRALLDRLELAERRLEDGQFCKEGLWYCKDAEEMSRRLQRAEAVVEALKYIHRGYHAMNYYGRFPGACVACKALAAWEEAR